MADGRALIKPSLPSKSRLVPLKCRLLLRDLDWLFPRRKHALLVAADFLVRVQAFQDELRRRHLYFGAVFWADVQLAEFFHQALDLAQAFENLLGPGTVAELNLSAEVEPLHHLIQVDAVKISIERLRDRGPDQLAAHVVRAFHLDRKSTRLNSSHANISYALF